MASEQNWMPIETAPQDGTLVRLKHADHPEYGEHLMERNGARWVGRYPGVLGWLAVYWDETVSRPTHWSPVAERET